MSYLTENVVLLPNLRYKNNNIFFISKSPIKTTLQNKITYRTEFLLEGISLFGKIRCDGTDIQCQIIEKEYNDGMEIKLKYQKNMNISSHDIKKFARSIEAKILGIVNNEDQDQNNDNDIISYTFSDEIQKENNEYINSGYIYENENENTDKINIIQENQEIDF